MKKINKLRKILIVASIIISFFITWFDTFVIMDIQYGLVSAPVAGGYIENYFGFDDLLGWSIEIIVIALYLNAFILPFYILVSQLNNAKTENNQLISNKKLTYETNLPEYNSAIAAFLLDGVIDVKKSYEALTNELIAKSCLKKENDKYIVIDSNLDLESEKYVLKYINEEINYREFKKCILNDAYNLGFIKKRNLFIYLILLFLFNLFYFVIFIILYYTTSTLQEFRYKFTKSGYIEKDKILRIKAYINDNQNNIDKGYESFKMALIGSDQ